MFLKVYLLILYDIYNVLVINSLYILKYLYHLSIYGKIQKQNLTLFISILVILVSITSFVVMIIIPIKAMAQKSILLPSDSYLYINKWGSKGSGNGQFVGPEGIAVDSSGNVYVSDNGNNRIQKFDNNGNFITKWDFKGSDVIQLDKPEGIAVDSSHNVYVTDYSSNSIIKCDSNGKLITKWITTNPEDIAIDKSGYVYVTDYHGILKFDGNGKLITKWGSYGTSNGQFIGSGGIAINSSGYVYVTDGDNNRIQVFAPVIPGILSTIDHNANANSLIPDNATSTNEKMTTPQAGISDQVWSMIVSRLIIEFYYAVDIVLSIR